MARGAFNSSIHSKPQTPSKTLFSRNRFFQPTMPPKHHKCVAKRYKKNLEEGQSSNPPIKLEKPHAERIDSFVEGTNPPEEGAPRLIEDVPRPQREFSYHERCLLLRRFSMSQVRWFMNNNESKVGDFVDMILASEEARIPSPKKVLPEDHFDDLSRDDYQPAEVDSESEEMVSLRHCTACDGFGCKEDMARCRKCGYWYHTECAKEPDREGKEDPNFSFWLCPKCKPDPKVDPGYKFTYRSKDDIEKDKHYEDSDYELEPDYRMWK